MVVWQGVPGQQLSGITIALPGATTRCTKTRIGLGMTA